MDKTKKKHIRRYVLWGVLALVVIGLAILPALARQQDTQDGPVASVLETTAAQGSVQTTVRGGGTLEAGDGQDIELPADVKITEFLVKNGQEVKEGDPVAKIDRVSAATAITEVRTSMAAVEKQMETYSDEKSASTVTAPAGGRVKAIYANPGDSVAQVLVEHGGLALLSLDGRMSVTLAVSSQLVPGDSINVTLASGKTVSGRVESNLNGELTVTIADNGYAVGDTVTLEGLGSGSLEIHNPWLATAFNGTVSSVSVRLEQTVSSGASLFTLKDTDYTAQRELLAQTHREYEELLQKLLTWQDTGLITAPCDGLVSGIDTDSVHLLAAQEEERLTADLLVDGSGEFRLVPLSSVTQTCTGDENCPLKGTDPNHKPGCPKACQHATAEGVCTANEHFNDCIMACTRAENPEDCPATGAHHTDCIKSCIETNQEGKCPATKYHYDGCIEKCIEASVSGQCPAHVHKKGCIESCISADTVGKCTAGHHKADCIESCIVSHSADEPCPATKHKDGCYFQNATYTGKIFKVVSVGDGVLVGYWDSTVYEVVKTASGWARKDGQPFSTNNCVQSDTISAGSGSYQAGDVLLDITVTKGDESSSLGLVKISSSGGSQMPNFNFSGMMGGFSMGGGSGTGSSTSSQLYSLDGDVLLTVTPLDTLTVTISVDEKDIASVKTGMTAQLTMNALADETFEGQVTRVGQTGSGSGGSSKFDVEITLSRESDMLPGMSVAAQLTLYEKMDVLTLPVAALQDEGGKTLVYTGKDKKTGELTNPVEVTTGLSDGENVEILSGIDSGTTVYYRYYDTVTESDAVETERSMF